MARGLRLEIMKSDMNRENKPESRKVLRPISDIERAKSHGHNSDVPQVIAIYSRSYGWMYDMFEH
eukprot:1323873-Amorphochlora_amoeboformis.AAC.1